MEVAVKLISKKLVTEICAGGEVRLLQELQNPTIVTTLKTYTTPASHALVFPM